MQKIIPSFLKKGDTVGFLCVSGDIKNYDVLLQRLGNIDKELDEVRSRFVKEA